MAAACSASRRGARTSREAQARAYAAVDKIDWPGGFCRHDIGWRAVGREGLALALSRVVSEKFTAELPERVTNTRFAVVLLR